MLTDSEHNCHQTLNFMNMSGPAPPPALFFSPPPASAVSSDAVTVWSIKSDHPRSVSRPELPPFKKPRSFEDTPSNSDVIQISTTRTLPPNPPVIRGMGRIFFKTRLCANFNLGICPYGISCNFAHGIEDLRKPPPNWHDMERVGNWEGNQGIVNRMRLCKRFSNGEECPYGERCNFLHEVPVKLREDPGRLRENSAINVGTTGSFSDKGRGSDQGDNNNSASSSVDSSWATQRPFFWKTRVCNKWEATGHCPYGEKCYYAHGIAELKKLGGPNEIEIANAGTATSRLFPNSGHDDASSSDTAEQMLRKKCLLKWKGPDKISRIYADWIDDLPFVRTLSSKVEN